MSSVITYRRVSTDEQAREGQSLEAQREALLRWAQQSGHVVAAEFADEGVSAWSTRARAGLAEAERGLADVEARINRVLSACETGALSNEEVAERMKPLRADKLRLKTAVETARASSADDVADLEAIMAELQTSFSETFSSLPMPEQQAAIRAIVGHIEVDQLANEMTVYFGLSESKRPELSSSLSAVNPSGELGKTWWAKSYRINNFIPVKVALPPSKGRRDLSVVPPSPAL